MKVQRVLVVVKRSQGFRADAFRSVAVRSLLADSVLPCEPDRDRQGHWGL